MKYDVALSFAGEDREYVEQVAEQLKHMRILVFYDRYDQVDLWGKDLYQHLSDVYQNKARYTVIFISQHYASKLWTRHELKSAQARAFLERYEYILPARFDDTEVPGIRNTIGYMNLAKLSPVELAEAVRQKLILSGAWSSSEIAQATPSISGGDYHVFRIVGDTEVRHELLFVRIEGQLMRVVAPEWEGSGFISGNLYIGRFKYHRGDSWMDCGTHELTWNGHEFRGRVQFDKPSWGSADIVWRPAPSA